MRILPAILIALYMPWAHAKSVTVSLATVSNKEAQLVCNGRVVLDRVQDLRLTISNGTMVVTYRPRFQVGRQQHVLIIHRFGTCQAHEKW